jgi:hypothetical protein
VRTDLLERGLGRAAGLADRSGRESGELLWGRRGGAWSGALVKDQPTGERVGRCDPCDRVACAVVVEIGDEREHERFAGRRRDLRRAFEAKSAAR